MTSSCTSESACVSLSSITQVGLLFPLCSRLPQASLQTGCGFQKVWFTYLTSAPLRDSLFDLGGYFSSQLVSSFKHYLSSPQSLPCCTPPHAVLFFPSSGSMSHWLHQRDGSPSSFPSSWCLPGHRENQMWDGVSCFRGVRGSSCMLNKSSPELCQWHLLRNKRTLAP